MKCSATSTALSHDWLFVQVPRNNFDTLLWAVVTVFQVITGENWNNIMYDTIRGNGMAACVYFISLVRAMLLVGE